MIGRIVWFAALSGIALLTVVLQVDLMARAAPQVAQLVPEPLRNYAQVRVTETALAGDDADAALAEARQLVRRRPLPAEYLALLAAAEVKAGQLEAAGQTIQIAGQRGWREPATQEAVLRIALAAGDRSEAARRYVALFLRNQTPNALLEELGPAVLDEADGQGRKTMVAIVLRAERWRALFLRRGSQVMPPEAFAAIASSAMEQGATFECKSVEQALRQLGQRDRMSAESLARTASKQCPAIA